MYVFIWFGNTKFAKITCLTFSVITGAILLAGLICLFINTDTGTLLLCLAALPALFALIYLLNWRLNHRRDRKYAEAQARAAQQQQYYMQQIAAQQAATITAAQSAADGQQETQYPVQYQQPQGYYPAAYYPAYPQYGFSQPEEEKLPGRGFAAAGLTLGIIGLLPAIISVLLMLTFNAVHNYYDMAYFSTDLIMFIIFAVLPALGLVFGLAAKHRKYPKKSATAAIILGAIGCGLILLSALYALFIALT